jgi:hypothetical protein
MNKPISTKGYNVYIRDTMNLTSAAASSLFSIGKTHDIPKINMENGYITKMRKYLEEQPEQFKKYALRDSVIVLIHSLFMESFNNKLGMTGVPLSLGSVSRSYIKDF